MSKLLKYYKHCIPLKFRFSDFDLIGHLNNAKYQTFLEDARIAYFREVIGTNEDNWQFNSVVSTIRINFIKPIEYGDEIKLYTRFTSFNAKTHEAHNLFIRNNKNGADEIVCQAHTLMAGFNYQTKQPGDFPESYISRVNEFEGN
jgi:acyl-CoA thioester hydrolase